MDMSPTLAPKSNQLNADDLIAGPRTITITNVTGTANEQQPVAVSYEGDNGKPYYPCKSMRRVMVAAWGPDAKAYTGRLMTLFRDPEVSYGGMQVGGIRISHMSHMDADLSIPLTVTRQKRAPYKVKRLATPPPPAATPDPPQTTPEAAAEPDSRLQATLSAIAKLPADMLQNTLTLAHTKLDAGEITPESFAAIKAAITSRSNQLK